MSQDSSLLDFAAATGEAGGENFDTLVAQLKHERPTLSKLSELLDTEARVLTLQQRIDRLRALSDAKVREAQDEYIAQQDEVYAGFAWQKAIAGARGVEHSLNFGEASYFICLPSGRRTAQVRQLQAKKGEDLAISEAEAVVLQWLSGIQLADQERRDISALPADQALELIRGVSATLINFLAERCMNLQQWLNLKMERELKNS